MVFLVLKLIPEKKMEFNTEKKNHKTIIKAHFQIRNP